MKCALELFPAAVENTFNPALVSGKQESPKSTSWIPMSFSTWTESGHRSCGQSAQIHFTPKPTCTHGGALVAGPKIYTPAWGAVKWPWDLTRGSCSSPGEKSVQSSACTSISFYLCWHIIMIEKITGKKPPSPGTWHRREQNVFLEEIIFTKDPPPPGTAKNASLAALLARRQQQSWASVYLFPHFHQEFN